MDDFDVNLKLDLKRLIGSFRLKMKKTPPSFTVVERDGDVWGSSDFASDEPLRGKVKTQGVGPWASFWISVAASLFTAGAIYLFGLFWPFVN